MIDDTLCLDPVGLRSRTPIPLVPSDVDPGGLQSELIWNEAHAGMH